MSRFHLRRRGASLAMVLSIALLMLTIGLGLATMVSLQLNLAGHSSLSRQSELLARAAMSQIEYEMGQQASMQWKQKLNLAKQPPVTYGLPARFQNQPVFPNGPIPGPPGSSVSITFDSTKPYYSTDNSQSSLATAGWLGTSAVPPFSVDLIITTSIGDYVRHYEAILSESWPYAAYSASGPMAVMNGSHITGSLYGGGANTNAMELATGTAVQVGGTTASDVGNTVIGDLATGLALRAPDPLVIGNPNQNSVSGRKKYQVTAGSLTAGKGAQQQQTNLASLLETPDTTGFTALPLDSAYSVSLGAVNGIATSPSGTVTFSPTQMMLNGNVVGNIFNGPAGAPGSGYWFPSTDQQMFVTTSTSVTTCVTSCVCGSLVTSAVTSCVTSTSLNSSYLTNSAFLTAPVVLSGTNAPTYHVLGSLVNHVSWDTTAAGTQGGCCFPGPGGPGGPGGPPPPRPTPVLHGHPVGQPPPGCCGLGTQPKPSGCNSSYTGTGTYMLSANGTLQLNNVVLVVDQDLDVAGIQGDASVLIVGGRLTLTGGALDAKDKGIVIQAGHVILKGASGNFRGLIVSKGTLETLGTANGPRLQVHGGLIAGDSMELSNTDVIRDPKYLAPVNRYGSLQVSMFRGLEE